jgi:hypothetical protein
MRCFTASSITSALSGESKMADPQNLNASSPSALSTGAPQVLGPPLAPAPQTLSTAGPSPVPSAAGNTSTVPTTTTNGTSASPPTVGGGTAASSTSIATNSGSSPAILGQASSGAPAQPSGIGLQQGGGGIAVAAIAKSSPRFPSFAAFPSATGANDSTFAVDASAPALYFAQGGGWQFIARLSS